MRRTVSKPGRLAFSLIEMMTAIAVLLILTLVLVTILQQAGKLWLIGESDTQNRQRARAALDVMGRELLQATLSPQAGSNSLQFVINPSSVATFANRDTVFWQAPITTDGSGGVAEVGYFVRWRDQSAALCRYFVNPSDPNYLIYTSPQGWVNDALLDAAAPASKGSRYQGLFLENIIGLWVTPYQADGTPYSTSSYSSTNTYGAQPPNRLPAAVELSIVMLDSATAQRVKAMNVANDIAGLYAAADPASFVASLPAAIRPGARISTMRINLNNYRP